MIKDTKSVIKKAESLDDEYNLFMTISEDLALSQAKEISESDKKGRLDGYFISVKDCVCVKDVQSASGSAILEGYKPVFDAAVISRIKEEHGIIIGKTTQDEFGFGSFNTNVGVGMEPPLNPIDKERVTGGSSGGAAALTRVADFSHIAISESTGGSIVAPAAYCGVIGLCPTYGRVSRYGLISYANSMDKIGIMAKKVEEVALMLGIIAGHDPNDMTSADVPVPDYKAGIRKKKKLKIGLIGEGTKGISKEVDNAFRRFIKDKSIEAEKVSLPLTFRHGVSIYYLISMSEASTNLAKLCGMRYGMQEKPEGDFNTYFSRIRSRGFSKEAKRRIILGTYARMAGFRDAYYIKALKARTLIIKEYRELFRKYDILISPTMPNIAPRFSEIKKIDPLQAYMMDTLTVGPNLAGFPHLTVPIETGSMPAGFLMTADHFNEENLLQFAASLEDG